MPSSRKRQDSSSSSSASPARSRPSKQSGRNRPSSPRRSSFNNNNNSHNSSHNSSFNRSGSKNTPTKFLGNDRAGLEGYLMERKRRKEEREEEQGSRAKEEKKRQDRKARDKKMKVDVKKEEDEGETTKEDPCKPNFEKSGKLAEERNTYKGIVIKYSEPQEARIPKTKWRLYPFKGDETLPTMYIHRNSGYLIGRERKVVDIPADHPSCSSQHAVIQFRLVDHTRQDGTKTQKVKPYLMDLESTNGSFINNAKIEARRYYELKERDIVKFGFSTREYVLLHERSEGVMETES